MPLIHTCPASALAAALPASLPPELPHSIKREEQICHLSVPLSSANVETITSSIPVALNGGKMRGDPKVKLH